VKRLVRPHTIRYGPLFVSVARNANVGAIHEEDLAVRHGGGITHDTTLRELPLVGSLRGHPHAAGRSRNINERIISVPLVGLEIRPVRAGQITIQCETTIHTLRNT
jgi:hypothetical protein